MTLACLLLVGAAGCESTSGPDVPNIAGAWTGTWETGGQSSIVQLQLRQSGEALTGTLTVGLETVEISGTVNEVGEVRFDTTEISDPQCSSYATRAADELQLFESSTHMEGVVQRTSCRSEPLNRTFSVDKL